MAQRILTQLGIDKARPRGKRYELSDGPGGVPGFALRVGETGCKSYVLRYRVNGEQRRITLGPASVMSLAAARDRARALVDQAKAGVDPAAALAERRERHRNTVRAVVEEYAERHLRRNLRSAAWIERRLARDVVASWGDRAIASVTTADVLRLVDGIADRGAGVSANRTLQQTRALFGWCVKRRITPTNPAAGIDLPHRERPRDRTLTEGELRAAWAAFKSMAHPYGDLGRLLLLLAQRQGETARMCWDQLDLERATWTIPGAVAKTGAEHVVPLSPAAVAIIEAIPRVDGNLVFPARVGGKPITAFGRALKTAHELSGTGGWHWHDLRRSARTGMARLGVLPHVAERILNHAIGSEIARTYDLHRYLPEMRRALELWADELDRIVAGAEPRIVPLRAS